MKKSLIYLLLLMCMNVSAIPLMQIETEDINLVYYSSLHDFIIPHILNTHHKTWEHNKKFWSYIPNEKPVYFINDFSDYGNGGATGLPQNFVMLSLAPSINAFDILPQTERVQMLITHELAHVIAMDQSNKTLKFNRKLFLGKPTTDKNHPETILFAYLTVPRFFAPRWYHEGIAVFIETWQNHGVGRTLGAYDEMVFRAIVNDDNKIFTPFDLEAEGTAIDFSMGGISYIYGTRFVSYLAVNYSPEKVIEWYNINESQKFNFESAFKNTFNRDLVSVWDEWIRYEREWQKQNLNIIASNQLTSTTKISNNLNGSFSKMFYDEENGLIYAGYKPYNGKPQLISFDMQGNVKRLTNISNAANYTVTSLAFNPVDKTLFYTTDNWKFRDLWQYDIINNKNTLLIKNLRAGNFAFNQNDKTLWGIRHNNGICTLIKLKEPYTDWTAIHVFPYGEDVYDLDISPDGTKLMAIKTNLNGNSQIVIYDFDKIYNKDFSYTEPIDFGESSPNNFVFSRDGKYIYGSSYYTGVSNIFEHKLSDETTNIITNTKNGLFRPLVISRDSLIAIEYRSVYGFRPVKVSPHNDTKVRAIKFLGQEIVNKHPQVKDWTVKSEKEFDFRDYQAMRKPYSFLKNLNLSFWHPIVTGYKDYTAYGVRTFFVDKTNLLSIDSQISYSPSTSLDENEKVHIRTDIRYFSWNFGFKHNYSNFYDLFGPQKQSRKGTRFELTHTKSLFNDESITFNTMPGVYATFNSDVATQNVKSKQDGIYSADNLITLSNTKRTIGAIDSEYGYVLNLYTGLDLIEDDKFSKAYLKADFGFITPVKNMNVWLRTYTGKAFGDRSSPYAYYYFGGFRNNYVDNRSTKQYRTLSSFAGFDINEISANDFFKGQLELNLPAIHHLKFNNLQLIPKHIQTSLFAGVLQSGLDDIKEDNRYFNLGIQTDINFILMSQLKTSLSFGFARAYDKDKHYDELMLSLSLFN